MAGISITVWVLELHPVDTFFDLSFSSLSSVEVSISCNRRVKLFFEDQLDRQECHLDEKPFVDCHPRADLRQVLFLVRKDE